MKEMRNRFPQINFFIRKDNNISELVIDHSKDQIGIARKAFDEIIERRDKTSDDVEHFVPDLVQRN
jgi:hypothetical protein